MIVATAERSVPRLAARFRGAAQQTSPRCSSSCTASRSPISTMPRRASRRRPCIDAIALQQRLNHSNVHRGVHQLSERVDGRLRGRAREGPTVHQRVVVDGDRLHARHDRVDQPGRRELRPAARAPATKCSSRGSSTTRTSFPGSCCASERARGSSWRRSATTARSTSPRSSSGSASARRSSRSRTSRTRSAP